MEQAPTYVAVGHAQGTALKLVGKEYYRPAGNWEIGFRIVGDKIYARRNAGHSPHLKHLNGVLLVEITEEQYRNDNKGYVK